VVLSSGACGQEAISETEVRSVFLYNFANFVRWPETAARAAPKPFRYCVLDESLAPVLDRVLQGERVDGRPIALVPDVTPGDLPGCHVLYVGQSHLQSGLGWELVHEGASAQVLTVSDLEGFETRGGMVALLRQGRRIRPSVNVDAIERGGLRVSAKLLSLATVTRDRQASN
jgi:hypothetical protein